MKSATRSLTIVTAILLLSVTTAAEARTAFGLHAQFLQRRAQLGYRTPAGFRWKAQTYPGLVGRNASSGYWSGGRYYYYNQPRTNRSYQRVR